MKLSFLLLLTTFALGSSGCPGKKSKDDGANSEPEKPFIDSPPAVATTVTVNVSVETDGLHLGLVDLPDSSQLECSLNEIPLDLCHDGAVLALPAPGDYRISINATQNGHTVGIGISEKFTVFPTDDDVQGGGTEESLALILDGDDFENGQTVKAGNDLKIGFKFFRDPTCPDTLKVQCKYDSRTSPFWTECDEGDRSYSVTQDIMATGLQFLQVRASCGDEIGSTLTLFWYGVPEDYQPLMIDAEKDNNRRYIFDLIRDDDCDIDDRVFECAPPETQTYALCSDGNVWDKPALGSKVRLRCRDNVGPELVIQD